MHSCVRDCVPRTNFGVAGNMDIFIYIQTAASQATKAYATLERYNALQWKSKGKINFDLRYSEFQQSRKEYREFLHAWCSMNLNQIHFFNIFSTHLGCWDSERRALGNYGSLRIVYMIPRSIFRWDYDFVCARLRCLQKQCRCARSTFDTILPKSLFSLDVNSVLLHCFCKHQSRAQT